MKSIFSYSFMLMLGIIFLFPMASQGQTCTFTTAATGNSFGFGAGLRDNLGTYRSQLESNLSTEWATSYGINVTTTISNVTTGGPGGAVFDLSITYTLTNPGDTAVIIANGHTVPFWTTMETTYFNGTQLQNLGTYSNGIKNIQVSQTYTTDCNTIVSAVPTMSQWGLIIFGLIVICIGAVAIFKKTYGKRKTEVLA